MKKSMKGVPVASGQSSEKPVLRLIPRRTPLDETPLGRARREAAYVGWLRTEAAMRVIPKNAADFLPEEDEEGDDE
jgi:hypothetical protein